MSQVRIAPSPADLHAARIGHGAIDLLLGADLVVSATAETLAKLAPDRSAAIVNLGETPTADVVRERDATQPTALMRSRVGKRCRAQAFHAIDVSALARQLFGDTLTTHTLLLGYAWQQGLVPLSRAAIERALELNGAAVALNKRAFAWGRIAAAEPDALTRIDAAAKPMPTQQAMSLDQLVAHHAGELAAYQDEAYADRYRAVVASARSAEVRARPGAEDFARAVSVSAYRLMAYKDEYEVARLYTTPEFKASLDMQFSQAKKISLWLAPPLFSAIDPATGRPKKRRFGPWILKAMRLLAALRGLRGTIVDPFGYTHERRAERALAAQFIADIERLCATLSADGHAHAVSLARLPQDVRGFGPVKAAAMQAYAEKRAALRDALAAEATARETPEAAAA